MREYKYIITAAASVTVGVVVVCNKNEWKRMKREYKAIKINYSALILNDNISYYVYRVRIRTRRRKRRRIGREEGFNIL